MSAGFIWFIGDIDSPARLHDRIGHTTTPYAIPKLCDSNAQARSPLATPHTSLYRSRVVALALAPEPDMKQLDGSLWPNRLENGAQPLGLPDFFLSTASEVAL
jgi:hypothetical protein